MGWLVTLRSCAPPSCSVSVVTRQRCLVIKGHLPSPRLDPSLTIRKLGDLWWVTLHLPNLRALSYEKGRFVATLEFWWGLNETIQVEGFEVRAIACSPLSVYFHLCLVHAWAHVAALPPSAQKLLVSRTLTVCQRPCCGLLNVSLPPYTALTECVGAQWCGPLV